MKARLGAIPLLMLLVAACAEDPSERTLGTLVRPLDVAVARLPGDAGSGWYALVANSGDDSLAVVDISAEQFLDFVPGNTIRRNPMPVGRLPVAVEIAQDQGRAFVLNALAPEIVVIDLPGFEPVHHMPVGSEADDFQVVTLGERTIGFLSRPIPAVIEVYDLDHGAYSMVSTWAISGLEPRGLELLDDAAGPRLFVANAAGSEVFELALDASALSAPTVVARHEVGGASQRVAVDPDGRFLYAVKSVANTIAVVDLEQGLWIDANPEWVDLDAAEDRDHEIDLATGGVPVDVNIVRYDYLNEAEESGVETVTVAFVTDYDGLLRGYDVDRDPHKIFDIGRTSFAEVFEPVYRNADGVAVLLPDPDHPSLEPIDPADTEDQGVEVFYRITRSERWSVIYNGQVGGSYQSTRGSLDLTARRFIASAADFVEDKIQPGDVLIIDSSPVGLECPLVGIELESPIELPIVQVESTALHFADTVHPLAECYAERELGYSIRVEGSFAVNGSSSGFKGRADFGTTYDNLLIRFTLRAPANSNAALEAGSGWQFSTQSGIEALVLDAGSVPGGFAFTAGDPDVQGDEFFFITNANYGGLLRSQGGILQVDAQTFQARVQYY